MEFLSSADPVEPSCEEWAGAKGWSREKAVSNQAGARESARQVRIPRTLSTRSYTYHGYTYYGYAYYGGR